MKKSLLFCAVGITIPTAALAQTSDTPAAVEEVVVTARRVAEPLQRTPVAVTALSSEQLEASQTTNVRDLTLSVPNLTLTGGRGASSLGFAFIRGIGQSDENPATDPGVAQYVDDVYIGRTIGALFDLNDIASIEVLRGPQGTLYGKNAIGGAIKINSRLPDNQSSINTAISYGNYNDVRAAAGISQPLVQDKLYLRVSAQVHRNDGYMENRLDGDRTNNAKDYSGRAILRYTPTSSLDIWLSVDGTRDRARPMNGRLVSLSAAALASPVSVLSRSIARGIDIRPGLLAPGADPYTGGSFDIEHDPVLGSPRPFVDVWGTSLHAAYEAGGMTLKSITAYRRLSAMRLGDVDATAAPYVQTSISSAQHQFSQELDLSGNALSRRFDWLAGLYYFQEQSDGETKANLLAAITPNGKTDRFFDQKTDSYAAFLSLGFKLTEALRLSAGGRYTKETKDVFTGTTVLNNPAVVLLKPTRRSADFGDFSPRLGLDYQITRDMFAYVSAAKGFKSGGFNGGAALSQALDPVNPEKVWSYESGLRTQWLDHRVTLNLTGFFMDYRDIQEQVFAPRTDGVPGVASLVLNAARAHIKGLELETAIKPLSLLTLSGDLGYTDAHYTGRFFNGVADLTHNQLPFTPRWTGRVNAHLVHDVSDHVTSALDVGYSYRSRTFYDATNTTAIAQSGYGLLEARAALTFNNGFQVAAFGKNLTNRVYQQNGVDFLSSLGFDIAYFGDPRTYGVELSWKY